MILRPGFIYGTRTVGGMKLPLGVVGSPMEMVNGLCFLHAMYLSILLCLFPIHAVAIKTEKHSKILT